MLMTIEHSSAAVQSPFAARAASQRHAGWAASTTQPVVHRFGRCELRPACREVLVNGAKRKLQPRPFDLLLYLIEHRDRVLSIDELLDVIWDGQEVQIGSLASAIARIRLVLGEGKDGTGPIIQTHHRVGYRFVAALEAEPIAAD